MNVQIAFGAPKGLVPDPVQPWIDKIPHGWQMTILTVIIAFIATRISRFIIRTVIRRLARASLAGRGNRWVARRNRNLDESGAIREERRKLRIDAASRMVNHLVSLAIWTIATIATFHFLDIDPTFYLSSAGFLGAAIAIGGQHKVNDYLTGLIVQFEDRYGVGDTVKVQTDNVGPVVGVVEHVGLFSTRLSDGEGTFHFPNSQIVNIENLSQRPAVTKFRVQVPTETEPAQVADAVRDLAGTVGLTDVFFVADVETYKPDSDLAEIEIRTPQRLQEKELRRLEKKVERKLGDS